MSTPDQWIYIPVTQEIQVAAQSRRAERDRLYGNVFTETSTDMRWLGEVGEMCFNTWLISHDVQNPEWILEAVAGQPDFIVNGHTVDVKTVKRQVPMRADYTAQVTARHTQHELGSYFFTCYETEQEQLVLLGGISRTAFLTAARYYGAGEKVHPKYTVRPGHEIYNIQVAHLIAPQQWLTQVKIP